MKTYNDFNEMRFDLLNHLDEEAPDAIMADLRKVAVNPDLTGIMTFFDDVYKAHKNGETISPELMQVVAAGLVIAAQSNFHGVGSDGTAVRKRNALLRDAGEPEIPGILSWNDPADDLPAGSAVPPVVTPLSPAV